MRVAKAQSELSSFAEKELKSGVDWDECRNAMNAKMIELRSKYEIPPGVYLFANEVDGCSLNTRNADCVKRHINAFVRGKLTPNEFSNLYFYFEECCECDYGWILIGCPLGFYDAKTELPPLSESDPDPVEEMRAIGTRSRSKASNLPKIAGVFSLES